MKAIGFNFSKVNAEKLGGNRKDLKINTKMDVSDMAKVETDMFSGKEDILEVKFSYAIEYNPNFAKVELEGVILFSMDSKQSKQILKEWKKKKISDDFRFTVFNIILKKSSLKALELEEELNLPYHMPMPSFKKPQGKK